MSDRHHCSPHDRPSSGATFEINIGASANLHADAYCRPATTYQPCTAPRGDCGPTYQPAYQPALPRYDRSAGTNCWTTGYDNRPYGGVATYNNGQRTWDTGTYSNPCATGSWNNGTYNWNQGSVDGYGNNNWNAGTARWNNGTENNYYTGSHVYSTGGVDAQAGNNFGTTGTQFGWNARNDNGYKTGGISWNSPTGSGTLEWSGTDSNYTYRVNSSGVGGNMATSFGVQQPTYYPQRVGY